LESADQPRVSRRDDALALAFLLGFWLLFFWPLLIARSHFIPYDLLDQHYMFQTAIHEALTSGNSVWWTPYILGGYPIIADPLSALFYPPNLLMHLLTPWEFLPYLMMEVQATAHFLLAAVGMYFLARSLTGSRASAVVAGLSWAFGSYFVWHLPHLSPISTLSWLPWILLTYARALATRSPLWIGLAALATGMMMLAGHAITILQIVYLVAAIGLIAMWRAWQRGRSALLAILGVTVLVLGLGTALGAVQLLPSWHLSTQTERAEFGFAASADSSFAPYWAVTMLLPNFFSQRGPGEFWAAGDPAEANLYLGLLPLIFAAFGVIHARREDRRIILLLLAGVVVAMALAFGAFAWPYRVAFDLLPGFDRVRRPVTFIALAQFAIALLAAYGVKALSNPERRLAGWARLAVWLRRGVVVATVSAGLAVLGLAITVDGPAQQRLIAILSGIVLAALVLGAALAVAHGWLRALVSTRLAIVLLVAIVAVDLGSAHGGAVYESAVGHPNLYAGRDWVYRPGDPLIPRLRGDLERERFRVHPEGTGSAWANGPLLWGIESAAGYVVLCPRHYCDLFHPARQNPSSPLFDLLNIRYLVTEQALEGLHPGIAGTEKFELVADGFPRLYENRDVLPRVRVVHQAVHLPEGEIVGHMQANAEILRDTVVLGHNSPSLPDGPPGQSGTAEIVRYENTRVVVDASLSAPGYLLLADTYYPGWEARVNGQSAPIYRANHAFRAVKLPAGEHRVEFRYRQPWLVEGALVSALAALVIFGLIAAGLVPALRRRLRQSP
jgi:hypothetical protein